jgi:hypothetical protein
VDGAAVRKLCPHQESSRFPTPAVHARSASTGPPSVSAARFLPPAASP